jgi:TRAP-type C4-dicarboxylate transport system permease small subunit
LNKIVKLLDSVSLGLHRFGTLILIPVMAGIITLDVILRYLFNSPLLWSQETNGLLLVIVLFLSLVYCWDRRRHVRMEIFYSRFGKRMKGAADIITGLVGIGFFVALGFQCLRDIPYMIQTNESAEQLGIQLWPFKVIIAAVSLLFLLKLLVFIFSKAERNKEV